MDVFYCYMEDAIMVGVNIMGYYIQPHSIISNLFNPLEGYLKVTDIFYWSLNMLRLLSSQSQKCKDL